jgi:hypothetical protein
VQGLQRGKLPSVGGKQAQFVSRPSNEGSALFSRDELGVLLCAARLAFSAVGSVRSNCSAARLAGLPRAVLCFCGGSRCPPHWGAAQPAVLCETADKTLFLSTPAKVAAAARSAQSITVQPYHARARAQPVRLRERVPEAHASEGSRAIGRFNGASPHGEQDTGLGGRREGGAPRSIKRTAATGWRPRQPQRYTTKVPQNPIRAWTADFGSGLPSGGPCRPQAGERRAAPGAYHRALPARLPSRAAKHVPSQLTRCTFTLLQDIRWGYALRALRGWVVVAGGVPHLATKPAF